MLEVCGVVRAWGEDGHLGVVVSVGGEAAHGSAPSAEKAGQAVHVGVAEEARQHPREDDPILQRIAAPGGTLRVVADDLPAPVRGASQVGSILDQETIGRDPNPVTGEQIARVTLDQHRWYHPLADHLARPVEVQ